MTQRDVDEEVRRIIADYAREQAQGAADVGPCPHCGAPADVDLLDVFPGAR